MLWIRKIPVDRLRDTAVERLARRPAELPFYEAAVDGIAEIVTEPVGHRGQQIRIRAVHPRRSFIENSADLVSDIDIAPLAPAAYEVGIANPAAPDDSVDGRAMVFHVKPVANVESCAIYRYRISSQRGPDHRRYELFCVLVGTVVVRAVGDCDRKTVGVLVRAGEMIGTSLARRIRRVGRI